MVNSSGIDTDASEFTSKEVNTIWDSSSNGSVTRDVRPVSGTGLVAPKTVALEERNV